ncbi:MAG: hypothetical protein H6835_04280 [Planctomycetes bacterium]|nr:hypothetical protein [Planctomycetota bacterium]
MRSYRSLLACLVLFVTLGLQSCTAWTVVQQAEPNPFVGQKAFAFQPLQISSVPDVGTEPDKVANRDNDMASMKPIFANTLKQAGRDAGLQISESGAPYTIRTDVTTLDLGSIWTGYSQVNVTVEIADASGKKLDVITIDQRVDIDESGNSTTQTRGNTSVTTSGPGSVKETIDTAKKLSSGNRIRIGAERVAKVVVDYLVARTSGG